MPVVALPKRGMSLVFWVTFVGGGLRRYQYGLNYDAKESRGGVLCVERKHPCTANGYNGDPSTLRRSPTKVGTDRWVGGTRIGRQEVTKGWWSAAAHGLRRVLPSSNVWTRR